MPFIPVKAYRKLNEREGWFLEGHNRGARDCVVNGFYLAIFQAFALQFHREMVLCRLLQIYVSLVEFMYFKSVAAALLYAFRGLG